ncbi:MAG TPA: TonB-dependent receptor [Steroidobacteraceae bacterium]|nr:TonB-dependent receptor [Steroidobacteraceae bacterium]
MRALSGAAIALVVASQVSTADQPSSAPAAALESVTVTATRIASNTFDVPAAISSVPAQQLIDDALGINLSDDIATVPGLLARDRNNYAQDQQISIRGIGANSAFGVRGVRIYQDGIPATGADGQGQVSQLNLDSAARVEVLRGPFSALYGNSSGGVIQVFTADGAQPDQVRASAAYGSFDVWRAGLDASGAAGDFNYNAAFTHFSVDGYRPHSAAENESFNAKLGYQVDERNHLSLILNLISRPDAQDPLGLTSAQFATAPNQAAPAALLFDTRKSLQQQQAGLIWNLQLTDSQSFQLMGYGGDRSVLQFLAIPLAAQLSPTSSGGVVDLDRDFGGSDARWSWQTELAGRPFSWVLGVSYDWYDELRRGYDNFADTTLGVEGELRRNENDITYDIDEYTQVTWDFASLWSLMLGLRNSDVNFSVQDHFMTPTNGNDGGSVTYTAGTPVAGLTFKLRPWVHLYASWGRGFETPLGSELAYRPDGEAGPNFDLRPARSANSELGAKFQLLPSFNAEATIFNTNTHDEIVVDTNLGGRSTYQNSGRTTRRGAEAGLDWRFAAPWHLQLAYTYVEATYTDAYFTCTTAPCAVPDALVPAGNRLPGVPKNNVFGTVRFGDELGPFAAAEAQYVSTVAANDVNSVFAPGYAVFGVSGGYAARWPSGDWSLFVRINNLLNRHYVGSLIVDDSNKGYFETAAPFNVLVGGALSWR